MIGLIVEDLYFRGGLLPRLSRFNKWAPLTNLVLFSLYHFFTPWQNPEQNHRSFAHGVHGLVEKEHFLGLWVHCIINLFGTIGMTIYVLGKR